MATITILLIEDTPEDVAVLREAFEKETEARFDVTHADRLSAGLHHLATGQFDLILLDLELPDSKGMQTVERVHDAAPRVPIVVLTSSDDDALAIQALQRGAQDYLVKGYVQVYSNLLGRSVRYAIERQRAEDAVRVVHAQTEQLLSSLPSILIRLNAAEAVSHWNAVAAQTFDIPAATVLGRPFAQCGIQWSGEKVQACIAKCRRMARPVSLDDLPYRRASGQEGFLGLTVVPMRGDGQSMDVLIFGADVTDRKQNELERTRLQEQLMQAQKMETIGRFAGGIAHDFNNFLQVILGFAWLIRARHQDDAELLNDLQEIVHAGESASGMVHQLLTFSRRQPLQSKVLEINLTIRSMARLLQQFSGESITVELKLSAEPLTAKLDPTRLEQILMNLCGNARDSMREGGTLTIGSSRMLIDEAFMDVHPGARKGEYVSLSIRDTGSGMDPAVAEHLFEPFFTTKQTGKGTGLGLAVVYGLVQQHEGFIVVDTAPGKGTAFHLYFPYQKVTAEELAALQTAAAKEEADRLAGAAPDGTPAVRTKPAKPSILVVDDDPAILRLCERILRKTYDVRTVPSGEEALEELQRRRYALLLSDLRMPNMDGVTLLDKSRTLADAPKLVAMTGSISVAMEERLASVPLAADIVRKPFTAPTLLKVIEQCLPSS